jgi:hypothetical protein
MTELTIETARIFEPLLKPSRYKGAWGAEAQVSPTSWSAPSIFWSMIGSSRAKQLQRQGRQ